MIRLCAEADRPALAEYLKDEPYGRMIADAVNAFGTDAPFQTVYIAEEPGGEAEDKKIAAQAAAVQYHIVKRGDTMGRIAINYHTTVSRLCQLNGLKNPDKLSIGQRIRVR